jgi:hypothetical protein
MFTDPRKSAVSKALGRLKLEAQLLLGVIDDQFRGDILDEHYISGDPTEYPMKTVAECTDNILMAYDVLQKALGLPKGRLARHERFLRGSK